MSWTAKEKQNGDQLLSVGVTLDSSENMLEMIVIVYNVNASCGVHPLDVESDFSLEIRMREYASNSKVVTSVKLALITTPQPEMAEPASNCDLNSMLEPAVELNKPFDHTYPVRVKIHSCYSSWWWHVVRSVCVIHCFTEDQAFVEAAMELGFISQFQVMHPLQANVSFFKEVAREFCRW